VILIVGVFKTYCYFHAARNHVTKPNN